MTKADANRILARWGWTPERIADLPPGRAEFIAEDVPRDKAFYASALAAAPALPVAPPAGPTPKVARALAEIRRVGLGDKRVDLPIGAAALKEALENIARGGTGLA